MTPAGRDARWRWVDLRLWPVAGTVWAVTLLAPYVPAVALGAAAASALLLAVGTARRPGRRGVTVAVGILAAVVVAAGTAAVRSGAREGSPLREPAVNRATVEVTLTVTGAPHRLRGTGPPRVVLDADVDEVDIGGRRHRLDAGVVVFAPAEGWETLLPGQRVRCRAGLAPAEPPDVVTAVLSARGPPQPLGEPGAAQRAASVVRESLAGAAARVLAPRPAGLLPGLVVGDTRAMDPVLDEEFRLAGLSHLTAVSGANVAIVIAGVLWPLRRRAVDRRVQAFVGVLGLAGFVLLAGPSASVVRAAAMGAVTLLALASGRARSALPALGAAVVVLLLADPALARDPGFALSVTATAAIVLLAPGWSRRLRSRGWPQWPADAVAVSAAAGLATAPLVAGLSGTVSLVSLPANLLAAPAVAPATVLGLVAALVGVAAPALGELLVSAAGWPVRWVVFVAERAAALPDAVTGWPAGTVGAVVLGLLLGAAGWALWRFAPLRPLALAALTALVVIGWPLRQPLDGWPPDEARLVACDVGQGDALVLLLGDGAGVLVDAGPEVGPVDRCLDRLGIHRLPLVLLSHLDADHVGGLSSALAGRAVGVVATGTLSPADDRAEALDALLRRTGATRTVLVPGDRRQAGGAVLEVLAPSPRRAAAAPESAANDLSLVVRVTVRGLRLLLTGDLGADAEERLVREGTDLRADVLKVPHHGSGDADPGFLAATGAAVALISVSADNTYGHPAPRLLGWLADAGMRVHRTDLGGDLAVVGEAGDWGIVERGQGAGGNASAAGEEPVPAAAGPPAGTRPAGRGRRCPVTPCRRASVSGGAHVPVAGGDGRGGAAALAGRRCGPRRGARPPPRRGGARAGRRGPADRAAGRRAGPVAVRRAPPRRRHRGPGGGRRADGVPDVLRQGPGPRADVGRRAQRRQAQRGAGEGLPVRRRGGGRVPEGQLGRRPDRLRAQRGAHLRRADHPRRGHRARRCHRCGPARALGGGEPAAVGLRRQHRRRRRRPLPPGPGRGHRLHRRGAGADRGPCRLHRDAAVGAGPGGRPRAHRRCDRRRCAYRGPGRLAQLHQPRRARPHAEDAALEGQEGAGPGARLEHRGAAAGPGGGRRPQCRREGRRGQRRLRPRTGDPADRHHPHRDRQGSAGPSLTRARSGRPSPTRPDRPCRARRARTCDEPPSRGDEGSFAAREARRRLRGRRPAWPAPTCGWRPGSCG
ncbi:DUF4131 domain-containing protein [Blastococcus saxobsidens]|uniref:DUF4131 domain-containing protein n=1 Tax=Blastococcus saxobsidens TaxID=138336 RepID=A0A6L9W484_9ACTN|nr:DUF4131 domain-containing protein [Blastococcus saxobsidens]